MARPRKNEHIKEQLLQVGLESLLSRGYHGTGIKDVLDRLGVPKGSFYHYFPSKESFAAEVVAFYARNLSQRLGIALTNPDDVGLGAIKSVFRMLADEHKNNVNGCIMGALASEIAETSEMVRLAIAKEVDNWIRILALMIHQGQATGEIRQDISADLLARMVWNCWEGALLKVKIDNDSAPMDEVIEQMLDILLVPDR